MRARVYVTLKPSVLDPQGQAVARSLGRLGFGEVKGVRIGKLIELELGDHRESSRDEAARVEEMCRGLLANLIIEDFRFELVPDEKTVPARKPKR